MPFSDIQPGSEREIGDTRPRNGARWLMAVIYDVSWFLLGAVAAAITAYAFTQSFGEGVRSIIFFVIPSMWGAYFLAVHDGRPKAIEELSSTIANSISIMAGLVVASILFLDTPISIANLALGAMEAFFFMMRISNQATRFPRAIPRDVQIILRTFLVMLTVTCGVIAATL